MVSIKRRVINKLISNHPVLTGSSFITYYLNLGKPILVSDVSAYSYASNVNNIDGLPRFSLLFGTSDIYGYQWSQDLDNLSQVQVHLYRISSIEKPVYLEIFSK